MDRPRSAQGQRQQESRAQDESAVTNVEQVLSVVPVGGVARHKKEKYSGKKLCQPNEAEVQRPPRDLVDLPAHRDRLHFKTGNDEKSCSLVKGQIWICELAGASQESFGFPHVLSTVP